MAEDKKFTRVAVIMAGGSGERFWPLSRHMRPKQLLRLGDPKRTMLRQAVDRLLPLIPAEQIYVVTGEHLVAPIQEADIGIPPENVLAEPCRRNTGGCLVFAAAHMRAQYGGDGSDLSMAVVTADHLIGKEERFRQAVQAALTAAEQHEVLATHGIVPGRPETGYGYIQAVETQGPIGSQDGVEVYPVKAFHEKPSKEKAEDFIAAGHYYWNSGMFFWRIDCFLRELEEASPEMAAAARTMAEAMRANDKATVRTVFEALENISIDYALMEHAKNVVVTRADYIWDDVGAWTSLDRTRDRDERGNVLHGDPVALDCEDCIIFNDVGAEGMAVAVVGMESVVVVVSADGVLVTPKSRAQDVRHAVSELKIRGARQV